MNKAAGTRQVIDIESVYAHDGEHVWLVAAMDDGEVDLTYADPQNEFGISVRFDLSPDEAHELGTRLRLMARKARS